MKHVNREKISKEHLHICTYIPQSITHLNQCFLDIMLLELEKMKWDVVGLSASEVKESSVEVLTNGDHLFNSGNGSSGTNGVGFLIHKSLSPFISDFQNVSDRLAMLTIHEKTNKSAFIQTYFPPCNHPDEEV